uniref:YqaJ viral recombinase domain-containing protein n=1 Tax=viral metagenome TaxID=1070528 RepID=A0A6C0HYC3_9ZZZZ
MTKYNTIDIEIMDEEYSVSTISENSSEHEEEYISFLNSLTEYEIDELESIVEDMLREYLEDNFIKLSDSEFINNMVADVTQILFQDLLNAEICNQIHEEEFSEYIKDYANIVFEIEDIPSRSDQHFFNDLSNTNFSIINEKIEWIRNQPQPEQRTKEWYEYRYNLITASNVWKAFSSESQKNSLIYEKCQPLVNGTRFGASTSGSLHWGVKYEQLSLMLYEEKMGIKKVEEFGCIRHEKYDFIGASPDGIVTDPDSNLYGRMIEIKNIVNRVIDGIPSTAYWIQMQVQMETCNLDACDFIETQIKEFETEEEFWINDSVSKKGIVLMFIPNDPNIVAKPLYKFMPLDLPLTLDSIKEWIKETTNLYIQEYTLQETKYWYLDIFSCVTVRRNKRWFDEAVPILSELWKTILNERNSGHDHRAPKKRIAKTSVLQNYIINKIE